jgi:hypothetical protein
VVADMRTLIADARAATAALTHATRTMEASLAALNAATAAHQRSVDDADGLIAAAKEAVALASAAAATAAAAAASTSGGGGAGVHAPAGHLLELPDPAVAFASSVSPASAGVHGTAVDLSSLGLPLSVSSAGAVSAAPSVDVAAALDGQCPHSLSLSTHTHPVTRSHSPKHAHKTHTKHTQSHITDTKQSLSGLPRVGTAVVRAVQSPPLLPH